MIWQYGSRTIRTPWWSMDESGSYEAQIEPDRIPKQKANLQPRTAGPPASSRAARSSVVPRKLLDDKPARECRFCFPFGLMAWAESEAACHDRVTVSALSRGATGSDPLPDRPRPRGHQGRALFQGRY